MKYQPKEEIAVFAAVKEMGEATLKEISDYLSEHMKLTIPDDKILRIVRRWKSKKIFALNYINKQWVAKIADIPPWYASGMMDIVKGTDNEAMRIETEALNERLKNQGRIIEPRGVYGNYKTFKLTFEALTPILGGRLSGSERELIFPRNDGKLFVPSNWIRGMLRDNAALINLPKSIAYHIAVGNGEFLKQPKIEQIQLKVFQGLTTYEAVLKGSKFAVTVRFPFKGTRLKKKEQIIEWFELMEEAPLRGLGANPRALGGRIKLVNIESG